MPPDLEDLLLSHCEEAEKKPFFYLKCKTDWIYILMSKIRGDSNIKKLFLCVRSKSFNPQGFSKLLKMDFDEYVNASSNPTSIANVHLALQTTGSFTSNINGGGTINATELTQVNEGNVEYIKEVVNQFGMDWIVLYNALLLKKSIVVISDDLTALYEFLSALPLLVSHRRNEILSQAIRPFVINDAHGIHIEDIMTMGYYLVGTLDAALPSALSSSYDLVVIYNEKRLTVANNAAADMKMCSFHKDLSQSVLSAAQAGLGEDEEESHSGEELLSMITEKTQMVLKQLQSIAQESETGKVTAEGIKQKSSNESLQQWLLRVAISENMV